MAAASVNGPGGWNILGYPLCHQLGEGACPLKNPPQLVGDLAYGDGLLFHCIASGVILRRNRAVYPTIPHPHRPLGWRPGSPGGRRPAVDQFLIGPGSAAVAQTMVGHGAGGTFILYFGTHLTDVLLKPGDGNIGGHAVRDKQLVPSRRDSQLLLPDF